MKERGRRGVFDYEIGRSHPWRRSTKPTGRSVEISSYVPGDSTAFDNFKVPGAIPLKPFTEPKRGAYIRRVLRNLP